MWKKLLRSHEVYLFFIMVAFSLFVHSISGSFLTIENMLDILKSASIMGIMAIGVFIVMLSGGIDISFPAIATVSMYITVSMLNTFNGNLFIAFLMASLIGSTLGLVNALIIHNFKMPTLIATLATASIFHGTYLSVVKIPHIYYVPPYFFQFGRKLLISWAFNGGQTVGLSAMTVTMFIVVVVSWLMLRYTMLGKGIYAMGGNMEAAKRAGFSIIKIQFFIYSYVGFLSGIASVLYVSLVRHVHPFNLMNILLDVIAAVVLGGASLAGGSGTVLGTMLGVIMIYFIKNSLVLMRVPSYWDPVVIGLIIVVSTGINAFSKVIGKSKFPVTDI